MQWLGGVLVETQVHIGCLHSPHTLFIIRTKPFDQETTITFLQWLSDVFVEIQNNEKDYAPYRLWILGFILPALHSLCHSTSGGAWRPTRVGLENPGGDPHSCPTTRQAGSCSPSFSLWEGSRKRRENETFCWFTRLCTIKFCGHNGAKNMDFASFRGLVKWPLRSSSRSTRLYVQSYSEFHDDRRINSELDTNLLIEIEEMDKDSIYIRRILAVELK